MVEYQSEVDPLASYRFVIMNLSKPKAMKYKELTPEILDKCIDAVEPPKFVAHSNIGKEDLDKYYREEGLKELVLAKTREAFAGLTFDEPTHVYHYKGAKLPSVSALVAKCHKHFNSEYWSKYKAKEYGITQQEVLDMWADKRDRAAETGSYVHEELEKFACKKYLDRDIKPLTINMDLVDMDRAKLQIQQGIEWLATMHANGYVLVATELMMVHKLKNFVGTADLIFWKDGKFVIADWKTNDKDTLDSRSFGTMYAPFNHLQDNPYGHYSVQLNLYKLMLEQVHPVSEMIIVHLKRDCTVSLVVNDLCHIINKM